MGKSLFRKIGDAVEDAKREALRAKIQAIIDRWSPILGVTVSEWNLRRMKTYWGSCNPSTRKITFDSKLADAPPEFLKITVVHELVHLVTKDGGHDDHFYAIMDQHLPGWRALHARYAGRMTPQS